MSEWVSGETVCKADQALGEVVHREPGHNLEVRKCLQYKISKIDIYLSLPDLPELHAGPPGDVDNEVTQVLPVPNGIIQQIIFCSI